MTKTSPAATDYWAVSTRTQGGVLTAGAALPSVELALLGIPAGFTPAEIQSWLRDLGGVALETSRTDERARPIPQLLHHALTGLLFSQTELWSHTGQPLPCAAVFVHTPQGVAFGWVGLARAVLLVNGEPHEPQWVIVRDESGQEAMSAMMPPDSHVLLTLEYWPGGEDGTQAPASLDAEWGQSFANIAHMRPIAPPTAPQPAVVLPAGTPRESPVSRSQAIARPPDAKLPMEQPGLAPDPGVLALDTPNEQQQVPSTRHPSSATFAMPLVPSIESRDASREDRSAAPPEEGGPSRERETGASGAAGVAGAHPVGRWLSRIVNFARRAMPDAELRERSAPAGAGEVREPARLAELVRGMSGPGSGAPVTPTPSGASLSLPPKDASPKEASHGAPDHGGRAAPPVVTGGRTAPVRALATTLGGLAAAGLDEILGSKRSKFGGSGPTSPGALVNPEALTPTRPPYPELDVAPVAPVRNAIQIEREPVGADAAFAIPRLPALGTPRPARVAVPTANDPPRAAPAKPIAAAPPLAAPPLAAPPSPATARAVTAPAPTSPAVTPPAAAPEPVGIPHVAAESEAAGPPEPPADFLAEFAASMADAAASTQEPQLPESGTIGPPPEAGAPVVPRGVSLMMPRPNIPPALAVGRRATAPATAAPAIIAPAAAPVAATAAAPVAATAAAPVAATAPAAPAPQVEALRPAPALAPPAAPDVTVPSAPAIGPSTPRSPLPGSPVLRAPTANDPVTVSEAEASALMRDLPRSATQPQAAIAADDGDVPEGMLVATPSTGARRRSPSSGSWPKLDTLDPGEMPLWRRPWVIGAFIAVLFGVGWLVGHSQAPDNDLGATPVSRLFRSLGLGGARFTTVVDSDPPGAFISVDGKPTARRTPSTIELPPGPHKVTLSMQDLGEVEVPIKGTRGQSVKVMEVLHGSLDVTALDPGLPVKMSLDGEPKGFLPVRVESLPPGLHELQFSGPNMQPWAQTVNVGIRQNSAVKARPMMSPATGVVQVLASLNDEGGTAPLSGAGVYVDGEPRGSTPLTLELPRGPHSLRVVYRGEVAPVQVIDLPGGNKRFASFQFGLDSDLPPLKLLGNYSQLSAKRSTTVEASLAGLDWHDLREAWLHVRTGEGLWRRYQMTISEGANGALVSANFPTQMFDAQGRVLWYMSAATSQGDEFHTEIQRSIR